MIYAVFDISSPSSS